MKSIEFSVIIPAKDTESLKLKQLIQSIKLQDFDPERVEILVITEGTAESAQGIGIKKARGRICVMLSDDNFLTNRLIFKFVSNALVDDTVGVYSKHYAYLPKDNALNRYFSLMGNNDPVAHFLGKCDRRPYYEYSKDEALTVMKFKDEVPTLGANGFFFQTKFINKANLDHYSHIDATEDLRRLGYYTYIRLNEPYIWHRTSDSLLSLLKKRYRYARQLYCNSNHRRWRMLSTRKDAIKLFLFCISSIFLVQPILESIRGFKKIRDIAWFWHPLACLAFLFSYGVLFIRWKLHRL